MDGGLRVGLARAQHDAGEVGLVGGVGEVIRFEAEGIVLIVDHAPFSGERAIEEVTAIELDAGFRGGDFEDPAGGGFCDPRGEGEFTAATTEDVVMVVALGVIGQLGDA